MVDGVAPFSACARQKQGRTEDVTPHPGFKLSDTAHSHRSA